MIFRKTKPIPENTFTNKKKDALHFALYRLNVSIYEQHVSRTIFMVIDALRIDFIQNDKNASMKYLNKLLAQESACQNNIEVNSPTVTMPRIKVKSILCLKTSNNDPFN